MLHAVCIEQAGLAQQQAAYDEQARVTVANVTLVVGQLELVATKDKTATGRNNKIKRDKRQAPYDKPSLAH